MARSRSALRLRLALPLFNPGGIDGSVEGAPTTLDTNAGLIDTPGLVGWLEMTAQPLLQFGTVALDPAPACRGVRLQAALAGRSSTSRNESEYRRVQRTAQIISSGSVCRHLKIAGQMAFFVICSGYQPRRPKLQHNPLKAVVEILSID